MADRDELLLIAKYALEYIDALPKDLELPAMPGFDRDWADSVIDRIERAPIQPVATQEDAGKVQAVAWTGRDIDLKTDAPVFQAVWDGLKPFELRLDDRGYQVGDDLVLRETRHTGAEMKDGAPLRFTGRVLRKRIGYILRGPIYGLAEGWAILAFAAPHPSNAATVPQVQQVQQVVQAPVGYTSDYAIAQLDQAREGNHPAHTQVPLQAGKSFQYSVPVYRNAAPQPVAAPIVPSDEQIIQRCNAVSIEWTPPTDHVPREPDMSGYFTASMDEMRALLTTASNAGEAAQGADK